MSSNVDVEISEAVMTITLNRPEKLNAITPEMNTALFSAFEAARSDDAVHAIRLRGSGRAFCAGADMTAGEATFAAQDHATFSAAAVDPPAFALRKPVIAAVNGHAIGLGLTLALVLMASIRETTELADVPALAKGMGLVLILAGSLSMAFMGFAGLFSS